MTLGKIAQIIGASVHTSSDSKKVEICRIYAGDKMSDLLNESSSDTLLITNLNNQQLIRAAELMDVPGICLVRGAVPDQETVDILLESGTVLMSSPYGMFETCGILYAHFRSEKQSSDEQSILHDSRE
jgi:hypothetical protein